MVLRVTQANLMDSQRRSERIYHTRRIRRNHRKEVHRMRKAIVIDANDIKKILAEKFDVPETQVIKSQYSFTVILDEEEQEE